MKDNKRDMDVVILAAGVGSRLCPITDEIPKCLVEVAGKPILGRLLHQLWHVHDLVNVEVHVVSGYRARDVDAFVNTIALPINVVINKDFETTNNMYSLYLSFPHLDPDRDLAIINGDCIYDDNIVETFFRLSSSAIAVDSTVHYEESMKVRVSDGCVRSISKKIKPGADVFTSIDLYEFSHSAKRVLINAVKSYMDSQEWTQWTEVAINQMLQDKSVCVPIFDIAGKPWIEIDTIDDLTRAEALFG